MTNKITNIENVVPVTTATGAYVIQYSPKTVLVQDIFNQTSYRVALKEAEEIQKAFLQNISLEEAATFFSVFLDSAPLNIQRKILLKMAVSLADRFQEYDLILDQIAGFRESDWRQLLKGETPDGFENHPNYDFEKDEVIGFFFR